MSTSEKSYESRRAAAETDLLTFLSNVGGRAMFTELLAIYHLHYAAKEGRRRYDNASAFLRRLEVDGRLVCTYNRDGIVIDAKIAEK